MFAKYTKRCPRIPNIKMVHFSQSTQRFDHHAPRRNTLYVASKIAKGKQLLSFCRVSIIRKAVKYTKIKSNFGPYIFNAKHFLSVDIAYEILNKMMFYAENLNILIDLNVHNQSQKRLPNNYRYVLKRLDSQTQEHKQHS